MRRQLIWIFLLPALVAADEPSANDAAWSALARVQYLEAKTAFAARGDRESKLGLATSLLNLQPRTDGNIAQAVTLLQEVRSAGADDEQGIEATYLLARIEQFHRTPANPDRAAQFYDELIARHPKHLLGQMSLVKRSMQRLYSAKSEDRAATFAAVEQAGQSLSDADARRDFHLMMSAAAMRLGAGGEASLRHLLAADKIGFARRKTAGDVLVRASTLARELNQPQLAFELEARFLREFPRDGRAYTIRMRGQHPTTRESTGP